MSNLQERTLKLLYGNQYGRRLLRILVSPFFSKLGGHILNTGLSALLVGPFVKSNHIDLSQCEKQQFDSYNDFFTRKLMSGARPLEEDGLIAPCDARLSVYRIEEDKHFMVKNTPYTVAQLLRNEKLAERFSGGTLWLFRLCVDDYHRYIYPENGEKSQNVRIPGVFHTVNPIANDIYPIYKENTREYCLLRTEKYGIMLLMEVGAMLVGKIENRHLMKCRVKRGEEKGNFAFGGSTIIMITQKGAAVPDPIFVQNTAAGIETKVTMGMKIGVPGEK